MNFPKLTTSAPKDPADFSNSNSNRAPTANWKVRKFNPFFPKACHTFTEKDNLDPWKSPKGLYASSQQWKCEVCPKDLQYYLRNKLLNCWGGLGGGGGGTRWWVWLYAVFQIRIQTESGFNQVSGTRSGSRRAKITIKIEKSLEISCFEVLDVLWRRLLKLGRPLCRARDK
jgi:hypothetical protein